MSNTIFDGLTVLEFGAASAPAALAGVLLADNGARVIKVEPPGGDRMRASASSFLVLNRGKESYVADLRTEQGRTLAAGLAARVDVVIEAFRTGTAERFGLPYAALRAVNPGLVYCSIKGFGSTGSYARIPAYEHVVQAKAGLFTAGPGGMFGYRPGPLFTNAPIASTGAGFFAAASIAAALVSRHRTGRGQHIETTLVQGITPSDYYGSTTWQLEHARSSAAPTPTASENGPVAAGGAVVASRYAFMPCTKDGRWVFFTALLPHQAAAILRALDLGHLLADPRYANAPKFASAADADAFENKIWAAFRTRTFEEWDSRLIADPDIAFELARTSEESLDHPQVRHNGGVVRVQDPLVGPVEQVGPLAHFSATPTQITRSAPILNAHHDLPTTRQSTPQGGATPEHPLAGLTIIEFGYFYAAPFGSALAASLGARVIKIEDRAGDPMRRISGALDTGSAKSTEGKESIAVDLRTEAGRSIVHALIARADAFVDGFRPGVAQRHGLDYDTLRELNPELVYVHAAGYGTDGPSAARPIYADCASAIAGAVHRQAGAWLDPQMSDGFDVPELKAVIAPRLRTRSEGDSNAALGVCAALTFALLHKVRTGRGQEITMSMIVSNMWAYADDCVRYPGKQPAHATDLDFYGLNALYRCYETADGAVFLAAPRAREWRALATELGLTGDAQFATAQSRADNDDALVDRLQAIFDGGTAAEFEHRLLAAGVACVAVFPGTNAEFTNTDPVLRQTGLVVEVEHPAFGTILRHGLPAAFSETPGRLAAGCVLGQHTTAILRELGYSPARIDDLLERTVVAAADSIDIKQNNS